MSEENAGVETPKLTHGTATVGQLVDSRDALHRLATVPLRGVTAMRVAKTLKAASAEIEGFETARVALVKELGECIDENDSWRVKPENLDDFGRQVIEMRAEPFALPCAKLHPSDLGDANIAAAELMALDWLFVEE